MKIGKSLFGRNMLLSAGMALLTLVVFSLVFSMVSYSFLLKDRRELLSSTAGVMAELTAAVEDAGEAENWQLGMQASTLARASDLHIFLCDPEGTVIACSDSLMQCEHLGKRVPDELIAAAAEEGMCQLRSDLDGFYEKKRALAACPVLGKNGTLNGCVVVSTQSGTDTVLWNGFLLLLIVNMGFVMLIAIPISLSYSRKEAEPLKELASAAGRFAKGELDTRVTLRRYTEETEELCEAFNRMADSLEKSELKRRDFISNVSHELKTPLTTISGYADGLLDGTIPDDQSQRYLAVISDEAKRMNRLVHRMLDIGRVQSRRNTEKETFDAAEVIRRTVILLEQRMEEKQLILQPDLPDDPVPVSGNFDDVSRVVYNLTENAVKFADAGSTLVVRLHKQNEKAYISVIDHGETIPEEEIPLIFDRFHKSDRSRSLDRDGVGLGLYLVHTILDSMGEDIWVRSRDGETEFRFSLTLDS